MYEPISAEAVQASYGTGPAHPTRPSPPPMLRSNNPEIAAGQQYTYEQLINMALPAI
jgi:hypothetical protein